MKKISILLPVLLAVVLSSFAGPVDPGSEDRARVNFARQFAGAENVKWSVVNDGYQKASFVWAGHRTEAYFQTDGRFVGAIRGLFFQQLPLAVIRTIENKYDGRAVLEAREITNDAGTSYSLLLDWKNKRQRVRLQADGVVLESEIVR